MQSALEWREISLCCLLCRLLRLSRTVVSASLGLVAVILFSFCGSGAVSDSLVHFVVVPVNDRISFWTIRHASSNLIQSRLFCLKLETGH